MVKLDRWLVIYCFALNSFLTSPWQFFTGFKIMLRRCYCFYRSNKKLRFKSMIWHGLINLVNLIVWLKKTHHWRRKKKYSNNLKPVGNLLYKIHLGSSHMALQITLYNAFIGPNYRLISWAMTGLKDGGSEWKTQREWVPLTNFGKKYVF